MINDFERYIGLYSAELTRLCVSLCGNLQDAEDLFQDTWYKAMRNYSKYKAELPFDKWLYSICVNTYKNNISLSYNRKKFIFKNEEEKELFFNSIPDIDNHNKDKYLELHQIISTLPRKQKIVLVLYYFKDYSIKEISRMLNIPEGTVKSRLYTAKNTIKRRLDYEK